MNVFKVLIIISLTLLTGCAAMMGGMSPEQMAQNVKDKNAVVGCTYGLGMYGQGGAVYVDTNKINDNQAVNVDEKCKVSITGTKSVPAAKPAP